MTNWVQVGNDAPEFSLQATDGSTVQLSKLKGQPVVLYFYPKDDTPGCTIEACAFRDRKSELADLGAVVLGVSPDDIASHGAFTEKFDLNFPLLADTDHKVAEAYGAWLSPRNFDASGRQRERLSDLTRLVRVAEDPGLR